MHFVVMRHGRRLDETVSGKLHGATWDSPLSPAAVAECKAKAHSLTHSLPSIEFGLILISPFRRCLETAKHVLPLLRLTEQCQTVVHKSLSEVHSLDIIFNGLRPTICQSFELWKWRRRRNREWDKILSINQVLGQWPNLGETWEQAEKRFAAVFLEAESMARGQNVLIISHAEAVATSVRVRRSNVHIEPIAYLGHTISCRSSSQQPWQLQENALETGCCFWGRGKPPPPGKDEKPEPKRGLEKNTSMRSQRSSMNGPSGQPNCKFVKVPSGRGRILLSEENLTSEGLGRGEDPDPFIRSSPFRPPGQLLPPISSATLHSQSSKELKGRIYGALIEDQIAPAQVSQQLPMHQIAE